MRIPTLVATVMAAIMVIAVLLVPTISDLTGSGPGAGEWQYDEYRPISDYGDVAVGGVLETVTIDGTGYIHAKGVGQGTIGGETVTVGKAVLDVVFMWGQSNGTYRNIDLTAAVNPGPGVGYYFGYEGQAGPASSENNTGFDLDRCDMWPMTDGEGTLKIGDKAPAFAAKYNELTGHRVYWVCAAIGGKAISNFLGPDGMLYTYAQRVTDKALEVVDTSKFELQKGAFLWSQGEANAGTPVNDYKSALRTVLAEVSGGEINDDPVFMNDQMFILKIHSKYRNSSTAQVELCRDDPHFTMATTASDTFTVDNGLMGPDNTHYSQLGYNIIGTEAAESVAVTNGLVTEPVAEGIGVLWVIPVIVFVAMLMTAARMIMSRD